MRRPPLQFNMCHFSPVFTRQQASPGEIRLSNVALKQVYFETNPGQAVIRQTALKRYQTDLCVDVFLPVTEIYCL